MPPVKLYRPGEVADLLGLQLSTIYHLISVRSISVVRPTRRAVRIPESEILRIQQEGLSLRAQKS